MMHIAVDQKVAAAGRWLADQSEKPAHVVRAIKEKFNLSALQACEACKLANSYRTSGKAFG